MQTEANTIWWVHEFLVDHIDVLSTSDPFNEFLNHAFVTSMDETVIVPHTKIICMIIRLDSKKATSGCSFIYTTDITLSTMS